MTCISFCLSTPFADFEFLSLNYFYTCFDLFDICQLFKYKDWFCGFCHTVTDRVGANGELNRELQYKYFYTYLHLVTDYICTKFGSEIIPEEENIDTACFCHTVMDKKYPQGSGV